MKVRELLDYFTESEKVKLIVLDGNVNIFIYHNIFDMPKWAFETFICTIELDDYCICIRSRIPDGYHLTLERQECEVSCCHD